MPHDGSITPTQTAGHDAARASTPPDYDWIRRTLARAVRRVCPAWLASAREDIVQTAMLRVVEYQRKGELKREVPASYLWKVGYTATADEIRRLRRRKEVPLEPVEAAEPHDTSRRGNPHEAGSLRELSVAIRDCLGGLSAERKLIVGFHLIGHTVAESMGLSGWSFNQVRNLLYRGLADLRRCLARKGIAR